MKLSLKDNINSLTYFKNHFNDILKNLKGKQSPFVITQNGRSAGVFLNIETWNSLLKKIQVLKAINEAENSISTEGKQTIEEVEEYFNKKYEF
jgi:prevent-host-death family protein